MSPLDAAEQIARDIAKDAIWSGDRCCWLAPRAVPTRRGRLMAELHSLDGSLYSGTAGIALFLAELSQATGSEQYREVARGALRHAFAWCDDPRVASSGLYDGAVGAVLAGLRAAQTLSDEGLRDASLRCMSMLAWTAATDDLIGGTAGLLLGHLMLKDSVPDSADMEANLVAPLIARVSAQQDLDRRRGRLVLGLGHGFSGIAMALVEAARAGIGGDLLGVARRLAAYERGWRDSRWGWPDLREHEPGDPPTFMWGWCSGAPGVALARVSHLAVEEDRQIREDALIALDSTAKMAAASLAADDMDYGLCHGLAGAVEILRVGAQYFPGRAGSWREIAADVIASGLDRYARPGASWPCGPVAGTTPGLLTGTAGVGIVLMGAAGYDPPPVLTPRATGWLRTSSVEGAIS